MAVRSKAVITQGATVGVPYVITGSVAAMAYGEPRLTNGISKLEYYRLGQSDKHLHDIQAILRLMGTSLDSGYINRWVERLGLADEWSAAKARAERDTA